MASSVLGGALAMRLVELGDNDAHMRVRQVVVDGRAERPVGHKPRPAQPRKLLGYPGLADCKPQLQFRNRLLALQQGAENHQPGLVRHRLEKFSRLLGPRAHAGGVLIDRQSSRQILSDGRQWVGLRRGDYFDPACRQPPDEARSRAGDDDRLDAVERMRAVAGELAERQFLWQLQPLDFARRSALVRVKDQEAAALARMAGYRAEILTRYGDANDVLLAREAMSEDVSAWCVCPASSIEKQ